MRERKKREKARRGMGPTAEEMKVARRPPKRGAGTRYVEAKAAQQHGVSTFVALREAAALKAALPPLQGWMLKRGDNYSVGFMNSWKLRYFRLEVFSHFFKITNRCKCEYRINK